MIASGKMVALQIEDPCDTFVGTDIFDLGAFCFTSTHLRDTSLQYLRSHKGSVCSIMTISMNLFFTLRYILKCFVYLLTRGKVDIETETGI